MARVCLINGSLVSHESCADAMGSMETGAMSVIETTAYVSLLALRLLGNDIRTTSVTMSVRFLLYAQNSSSPPPPNHPEYTSIVP